MHRETNDKLRWAPMVSIWRQMAPFLRFTCYLHPASDLLHTIGYSWDFPPEKHNSTFLGDWPIGHLTISKSVFFSSLFEGAAVASQKATHVAQHNLNLVINRVQNVPSECKWDSVLWDTAIWCKNCTLLCLFFSFLSVLPTLKSTFLSLSFALTTSSDSHSAKMCQSTSTCSCCLLSHKHSNATSMQYMAREAMGK